MSNNIWQMKKQAEQFEHGKTTISRVNSYVKVWEDRCYKDGIPDEVAKRLSDSMRVPSYKAIAMAILQNDLALYTLGFQPVVSHWYRTVKDMSAHDESGQVEMF
jgi:predicted phosphoadenosine phosphosulfate sulfurtransferase